MTDDPRSTREQTKVTIDGRRRVVPIVLSGRDLLQQREDALRALGAAEQLDDPLEVARLRRAIQVLQAQINRQGLDAEQD